MTRSLLFAFDDRVTVQDDGSVVSYCYTRGLVDRYRYLADHVTFVVRGNTTEPFNWFPDATMLCVPDMKREFRPHVLKQLRSRVSHLVSTHDIIVARLPSILGAYALRSAWQHDKPVIAEFVGCPWDALWNYGLQTKLAAPYFWAKNRYLMSKTSHAYYVTDEFLQRRYPSPGHQVAASNVEIELATREQMLQRTSRMASIQRGHSPIILGTIANLTVPYKGHHLVFEALAQLGRAREKFIYRLIGPGDPTRLQRYAQRVGVEDQIEFLGPRPRNEIPETLDDVDIYIQPSKQEGLPRAVIEAMARGCPVIGAKTGGIPELLTASWIVPRGSSKAIASLLTNIGNLPLAETSQRNFEKAKNFTKEALHRKRTAFYNEFLQSYGIDATALELNGCQQAKKATPDN